MKIRLYLDEDTMRHALVSALRARGVDLVTASEADMIHRSDMEHVEYATAHGRVVCTCNLADFTRIHAKYLSEGKSHAGIIVIPQQRYSVGDQARRLLRLVSNRSAEDMKNHLEFLSGWD